MAVQIEEFRPVQSLRPHVQRFWTGRFEPEPGGQLAQRVVPSGFVECIIHLTDHHCDLPGASGWRQSPDYTLIGLQRGAYEVRFSEAVEVFAIRFRPAGVLSLFGVPLGEIVDSHEDLGAVLGGRVRDFAAAIRDERDLAGRLRVAEGALERAAQDADPTYLNVAEQLVQGAGGALTVAALVEELPVSRRQLERAFKEGLGVGPKQYLRIARLNAAQRILQGGQYRCLADVAYAAGYADQAHFTREFKALVGHPPSRFLDPRGGYAGTAAGTLPDLDPPRGELSRSPSRT